MNTAFLEVVVSLLLIYALSACAATEGSIVILEDGHGTGFTMNFEDFDSINKCELSLTQGDVLQVEVEREEGGIAFSVSGKNGSEPYTGNDMMPGIFTVTVSETDDYVFSITGNNATGKIRVKNLGPKME